MLVFTVVPTRFQTINNGCSHPFHPLAILLPPLIGGCHELGASRRGLSAPHPSTCHYRRRHRPCRAPSCCRPAHREHTAADQVRVAPSTQPTSAKTSNTVASHPCRSIARFEARRIARPLPEHMRPPFGPRERLCGRSKFRSQCEVAQYANTRPPLPTSRRPQGDTAWQHPLTGDYTVA